MIEETKYCNEAMKTHFNKELVMTREKNLTNSTKCWFCDRRH